MDYSYTSISANTRKGVEIMKKSLSFSKTILLSIASIFVVASDVIAYSGSFLLLGEPKCPKSLLK